MSENLFLGDTNYPHALNLVKRLREDADKSAFKDSNSNVDAAHIWKTTRGDGTEQQARIEQLERELATAKIGHARYEFVRKLNIPEFSNFYDSNICFGTPFDELIDAAIQEGK